MTTTQPVIATIKLRTGMPFDVPFESMEQCEETLLEALKLKWVGLSQVCGDRVFFEVSNIDYIIARERREGLQP